MKKNIKFITSISILSLFFQIFPAQAFLLPGAIIAPDVENSNQVSTSSTSTLTETENNNMGSSDRAESKIPKVDILLTPSHPDPNQLVYTQALPENFRNSSTKLYYNWYIYNPDPKVGVVVIKNGEKVFVPSNTLEGALIRGAMSAARGQYVPGVSPKAKDLGKATESSDQDKDGYKDYFGGDDGQGAVEKKIEDILGDDFDFNYSNFNENCKQNCKVNYDNDLKEIEWTHDNCYKPTCDDYIDNCCAPCKNDFDNCMTDVWDGLSDQMDKICKNTSDDEKSSCLKSLTLENYQSCNSDFNSNETNCMDSRSLCCLNQGSCGTKPSQDCTECDNTYYKSKWESIRKKDLCVKQCGVEGNNSLSSSTSSSTEPVGSRCFRYNFGGRDVSEHLGGIFQPITCMHLIPGVENPDDKYNWGGSIIPFKTGDGSFKDDEEIFWGTDPTSADTDSDGFVDEADLTGLGQQTIYFNFQPGDKIGVAVEGTSLFPTNEKTPYYKIMWAYLGVCNSDVMSKSERDLPGFNNLCTCDDKKDGKCIKSNDFGFGYLGLKDIWQNSTGELDNKLDLLIDMNPQLPTIKDKLTLEGIVSGNELDKDLLNYQWTLKHEESNLQPVKDEKEGRIIWKKQGVDVAYTPLDNKFSQFNDGGGVGWRTLTLEPLLEGKYDVVLKTTETKDTKKRIGETTFSFNVSENLKIKFYRASFEKGTWEKKEELSDGFAIPGEDIVAEYNGPFYDDFVWYVDKQQIEGNMPKITLKINKNPNSAYYFRLNATNRNRSIVAEDNFTLKVVNPIVRIRPSKDSTLDSNNSNNLQAEPKDNLVYKVPLNNDLRFVIYRGPTGSSFSSRGDLKYYWSFDNAEMKEGSDAYSLKMDSENFLPGTPHSLSVQAVDPQGQVVAEDKITLMGVGSKSDITAAEENPSIAGMAFVYLNFPMRLKFILQSLLWVVFLYLLLNSIAWLAGTGENSKPRNKHNRIS